MSADRISGIEFPRTRDQLELLVLRYSALKAQGVVPTADSPEMCALTLVLQAVARQQRTYTEKIEELKSEETVETLEKLPVLLRAYKQLSRDVDIPTDVQAELRTVSNVKESVQATEKSNGSLRTNSSKLAADILDSPKRVAEGIVRQRIGQRLNELELLAANLGTIDAAVADILPPDELPDSVETLKTKAIIEMKQLRLLARQKSLRQHIIYHVAAHSDPLGQSLVQRLLKRRVKLATAQELQLTEQLERQQRLARERALVASNQMVMQQALDRVRRMRHAMRAAAQKHQTTIKIVQQFHTHIEREEARRVERTAKQRLAALRANDEEAYIKLLDQTKDTRITHLLRQTNQFLASLTQAVRVQQAHTGGPSTSPAPVTEITTAEDGEDVDYYEVAHRIKEPITQQASILTGGTLKEYQVKGLQWMVSLVNNNLNGILADEMGLGKTIQTISLITYLIDVKKWSGPFLVIVPLSTLTNWNVEFDKWAPTVKKIVYKGPPNTRKNLQTAVRIGDFQVLLTTYEYIIKDRPLLSKIRWQHMIIDEGHRMKNTQSKLSSTLVQYYHSKHRLILTGTPLQNNLPELWALLNFVLPKIFNSVKTFDEWFNTPFANTGGQDKMELTEEELLLIIRRLHKVLRPFLLRRLKKDVEKDLPDKVEKVIKCKMSALQRTLYDHMVQHNVLYVGSHDQQKGSGIRGLNNKIVQLRKICNHPYVFEDVEDLIDPSHREYDLLWRTAGKFELLDRILPKFAATNHRVLMFFQMTQIMTIMEDYLQSRGFLYLRLDGSTKADERSEMLHKFNDPDSPYFCFLLSTRAGGLGLNLQTADTVIIYDTDWNPFQDLQAQDRAHRIGQTKEVRILRLITANSIEEAILDRAVSKLEIDGKVIQAGKFDNKSTSEEQEAFLRNLMEQEEQRHSNKDEDDEELDEDDLNSVLARTEEEAELFARMDTEMHEKEKKEHAKPRLFSQEELPEIYKEDIRVHLDHQPDSIDIGGRRSRTTVQYDDGLTDREWLQMQEDSDSDSVKPRKRGRPRKSATPQASEKRQRVDTLSAEDRDALSERCTEVLTEIDNTVDTDVDPPRSLAGIFQHLPSRRQYPDYYHIIKHPISLREIRRSIDDAVYTSFGEFASDLQLMLDNARTYNQKGSWVYNDADTLQEILDSAS